MINVDEKINELINKNKGKYITQACAFNKECPRQMALLKFALESSVSFSGLIKELLALKFDEKVIQSSKNQLSFQHNHQKLTPKSKNIGNFI